MARAGARAEAPPRTAAPAQCAERTRGIYASPRRLSCGLFRPVHRHARRIAAAPAVATCPLETGKRTLDQRQLEAARLAFCKHRAQILEPTVDGETYRSRVAALEHGRNRRPAHLDDVGTARCVREQVHQPARIDSYTARERQSLAERLPIDQHRA